jgi:hypothetical protein
MYTEQFTEVHDILATLKPTAASAAVGVHNSGYVSLADYHRAFAWLAVGEPGAGATIDVAITQATSVVGAGAVPLLTVGAATKDPAQIVAADIGGHVGIEVRSEELDVTNLYVFINVSVTVTNNPFYYDLVIFGIVSRYEPVGVTDFLYLMP